MEIDKEQIKEYLQKFRITNKEQLATHIEELKRNTVPNTELISELVYVLEDDYFFRAPHTIEDFLSFPNLGNEETSEGLNEGVKTHIEGVKSSWEFIKPIFKDNNYTYNETKKAISKSQKGVKTNNLKPQMSLLFKQFPKALEAVVMCSQYGHEKYKETDEDYLNYTRVDGGSKTYADAGLRHRLEEGNDLESRLPHQFHVAWNALAELELWIKENEN